MDIPTIYLNKEAFDRLPVSSSSNYNQDACRYQCSNGQWLYINQNHESLKCAVITLKASTGNTGPSHGMVIISSGDPDALKMDLEERRWFVGDQPESVPSEKWVQDKPYRNPEIRHREPTKGAFGKSKNSRR